MNNSYSGIIIVGPTASGKTTASIEIAKHLSGEVISADSRQIYRGLDIGSGKVTVDEMSGIKHHLINVADPGEYFSADNFRTLGNQALEQIIDASKLPIICGGTGFYIDTLVYNRIYPEIDPRIKTDLQNLPTETLRNIAMNELPSDIVVSIDTSNPVRLRNRIGLYRTYGEIPPVENKERDYDINWIWSGINPDSDTLRRNIEIRTRERIEVSLIKEVEDLIKSGVNTDWLRGLGMEYQLTTEFIEGDIDNITELEKKIIQADLKYAKRQLTWFKRNKNIIWHNDYMQLVKRVIKS